MTLTNVTVTSSGMQHWAQVAVDTGSQNTLFQDHYHHLQHGLEPPTTAGLLGQAAESVVNGTSRPMDKKHTVMVACVMFGAGVFGNVLALFVLATSSAEQRKTLFYKLVAGLAATDLLGTTATSPVVIAVYMNDFRWVGGEGLCHYFSFAMIFACFATLFIVCAMSIERYICLRHPYIYHTRVSGTKFARLTLLSCWALSLMIAALPVLGVGSNVKQPPHTWCFFDFLSRQTSDVVFNYLFALLALVCVLVTFVCNVCVIYTLLNRRARQSRLDASESSQGRRRSRATSHRFAEVQMMVMLIGITVVFTLCFAPLIIFVLLCQTGLKLDSRGWVLTLVRIASFNPILDPWVYILFRRELVWRVMKLGRFLLGMEPKQRPSYLQQSLLIKDTEGGGGGWGGEGGAEGGGGIVVNGDPWKKNSADGSGSISMSLDDPYNPSCLAFCYQCLFLPPVPRASCRTSLGLQDASRINRVPSLRTSPRKAPSFTADSPAVLSSSQPSLSRSSSRLVLESACASHRLLLIKMTDEGGSLRSASSQAVT